MADRAGGRRRARLGAAEAVDRTRQMLRRRRRDDARTESNGQDLSAFCVGPVAVLSDGKSPLVPALRARGVPVVELDARGAASERHARLAAGAPYSLVVDDVGRGRGRARRLRDTFFHVESGGAYVVRGVRSELLDDDAPRRGLGRFLARLRRAGELSSAGAELNRGQHDLSALAAAVASAKVEDECLVLVSQAQGALAKLDEDQIASYIRLRDEPGLRVLERLPTAPFRSGCELHDSTGARRPRYFEWFDPPAPTLREYHDVVCSPGQVVVRDTVLLPDTYRHSRRARLRNPFTTELGPLFASVAGVSSDLPVLEGTYFHLDNEECGHFGHAMTEQLSRMWALPSAREHAADLKVLMSLTRQRRGRELKPWERQLLIAAGVDPHDVVLIDAPVRVERLLSSTPLFSMPDYVDPRIAETWRKVGDALAREAPERDYPRRIFCGRSTRKRACRNAAEVEALFDRHGFEVVRPEQLSLGQQVHMFRAAEVVAGYAGSALLSTLYAEQPQRLISVTSRTYNATNEYLIASVLGHRLDTVVGEPEQPTFKSPYTVDLAREGRFLREVLETL